MVCGNMKIVLNRIKAFLIICIIGMRHHYNSYIFVRLFIRYTKYKSNYSPKWVFDRFAKLVIMLLLSVNIIMDDRFNN